MGGGGLLLKRVCWNRVHKALSFTSGPSWLMLSGVLGVILKNNNNYDFLEIFSMKLHRGRGPRGRGEGRRRAASVHRLLL